MPIIRARNLVKNYGKLRALDSLSLDVEKGEIFGLLGPNGAGKTTLISILTGLLLPDDGSAEILGMDMQTKRSEIQERINVVTGFSRTIRGLSIRTLLRYYAMLYDVKNPEKRINELLELVELSSRADDAASDLSTGLRQRFYLAKALLNKPELLFLDEPTVGLDVEMAIKVRALIKQLKQEGYTILLTTHYMQEAEELCDRIGLINDGKIIALGTAKELKQKIQKETFIEVRTTQLHDLRNMMQKISGVEGVLQDGSVLRAKVSDSGRIKPIMRALLDADVKIDGVSVVEPSLEEVFLKLTKKRIANEQDGALCKKEGERYEHVMEERG